MHTLKHFLLTALLGTSTLLTLNEPTVAGRIGGPASERITIPANQSVFLDIPFAAGEPAMVSVTGTGTANVGLAMYDGDGNNALGVGFSDRKTTSMRVYREGLFRIEVRNLGPTTSTFTLQTN